MKIAVPVENGQLSAHFGRCRQVSLFNVDMNAKRILNQSLLDMPMHVPGAFPSWLSQQKVDVVIASGMGHKALMLFENASIRVVLGAPCHDVRQLVEAYLTEQLTSTANICNHDENHECEHESQKL